MTPLSPQDNDKNLVVKSAIYYTNRGKLNLLSANGTLLTGLDVRFLHEVVSHAQELLPTLPERERVPTNALFTAYYSLLANIGVDADHDSRYARILFKIGGTRGAASLFEKFESILSQMGIELEFDKEAVRDNREDAAIKHTTPGISLRPDTNQIPVDLEQVRGHHRHNSETTPRDVSGQTDSKRQSQNWSQSPIVQQSTGNSLTDRRASFPSVFHSGGDTFHHFGLLPTHQKGQDEEQKLILENDRHAIQDVADAVHSSIKSRRRSSQPSEFDSGATSTWRGSNDDDAVLESIAHTAPTSKTGGSDGGHIGPFTNSETLMGIKISLLRQYYNKSLLRQSLLLWRQATLHLTEDNGNLELLASYQDRQVLLRQAFDSWLISLRGRQQATETERFFDHLEGRADRARDIFILAKAFFHWVQSAQDESQKTSVARRHILRTRYFEAWRGLTAIHELKIRRQVLKKFLAVWEAKAVNNSSNSLGALFHFRGNIVHRLFWTWFTLVQDHRALAWRVEKLQGRSFFKWAELVNYGQTNQEVAIGHYDLSLTRTAYLMWTAQLRQRVQFDFEAEKRRKKVLSFKVFRQFGLTYSLCLPTHRLESMVSSRLKYSSISLWLERARQESFATNIDRQKIKGKALVAWSHKFRCRTIQSQIHRRFVLQAFRSWMLAERQILSRRLFDRKVLQTVLHRLSYRWQAAIGNEARTSPMSEELADHNLTVRAFTMWRECVQSQSHLENAALEFATPRLVWDGLADWVDRTRQVAQMRKWAQDGEFYFLANKSLKLWKNAAEDMKREKRRVAYVNMRRRTKLNLATRVLSIWHRKTVKLKAKAKVAVEVRYSNDLIYMLSVLNRWRGHTNAIACLDSSNRIFQMQRRFIDLKYSLSTRQHLEREAVALFVEQNLDRGVKKWARAALQLRASHHVVSELLEKHSKKILRKIIGHWRQRASDKVSLDDISMQSVGLRFDKGNLVGNDGPEAWSELGDDPDIEEWARSLEDEPPSSTIPGYLSTPSKKISWARTLSKISSTTPIAPLSTPFEKHLRAQYTSGLLTPSRHSIRKKRVGTYEETIATGQLGTSRYQKETPS